MLPSLYCRSHSASPPLRIGILLDTAVLPRCFAEVVEHIVKTNFARLELLAFNADARQHPAEPRRLPRKMMDLLQNTSVRRRLLFLLYERWDRQRLSPNDDPLGLVDCSAHFGHIESFDVTPLRKRFVHIFPADAVKRIQAARLDVLIRFGFNILRGEVLHAAKYGVWSFHHGDNEYYRGGPPYFWEVYENNPISGAVLQVLTEELDAGKILYKGLFETNRGVSCAHNRVRPYWGSSTFMVQKLRELHQYGWEYVDRAAVKPASYKGKKRIYTAPTNREMIQWLAPVLTKKIFRRLVRRPKIMHWRLAVRVGDRSVMDSGSNLNRFRWIESPKGHFYADPFLIEADGRPWVFFEDFDYAMQRGTISCAEVGDEGIINPISVLKRPYHLSYPCVFREDKMLFMIPETRSNGTIELYRCVQFPDRWEKEREFLRMPAVDTTIWIEGGLYWFFVTIQEPRGNGTQLWLFYATNLSEEWTPHPQNPISTDVRNSRGAGAIFRTDCKLFRPSQDCSENYGHSFTLNEIVALDRQRYEETPSVKIDPDWFPGLVGTHTYSKLGRIEIIDGCCSYPARRLM